MIDAANAEACVISYAWTRDGRPYLAVILDLHSWRVVDWAVSNRMKCDLAIRAFEMAISLRNGTLREIV
jgi:transposase InsO family protein